MMGAVRLRGHAFGLLYLAVTVTVLYRWLNANETTAALALLVVVLLVSATQGLLPALTVSVAAMLGLNYFFIPPIGTFTVSDPQNWIALTGFLVTALTASNLAARAERRAAEALAGRTETERLYQLGRTILINENAEQTVNAALNEIVRLFELKSAAFYGTGNYKGESLMGANAPPFELFERAVELSVVTQDRSWFIVPVRMGETAIGALGLNGPAMTRAAQDASANLLAIAIERKRSLRRAAEGEAARISDSVRSALLDGLAHDLKTPLTAVRTSITALLNRNDHLSGNAAEYLAIIHEESDRLNDVVSNAIESARLEKGPLRLQWDRVDMRALVEELTHQRASITRRFHVSSEEPLARVVLDRNLIKLALKQILENAVRYSPDDQPIDILLAAHETRMAVTVADRGPGVRAAERERIFESFYRGKAGQQVAGGTGLGLAVAKRIVEAHGGTITVGEREGGGTEFKVQLPLEKDGIGNRSGGG